MTYPIIIQPLAEADMTEAALRYENQRSGLGDEFLADIHASLARAAAHPRQFLCLRRRPEVRRILIARFPCRIFFVLRPDALIVFRVLHGARRDREWKGNVPAN